MNRPLAAFGALMTLLMLAMFAVSSTSRSTSVQAARPGKRLAVLAGRGNHREPIAISDDAHSWVPQFQISDLDSVLDEGGDCVVPSCGLVFTDVVLTRLKANHDEPVGLTAVRILPAADMNETWQTTELAGCLSYYDAEYDRIVYGEDPKSQKNKEPKSQKIDGPGRPAVREIADEEMAELFYGLVNAKGGRTEADGIMVGTGQMVGTADPMKATAREVDPQIDWSDYAELLDEVSDRQAVTAGTTETSGNVESVRSSGWLRHSAALSLYRVGALLQAAADEVERAREDSAGRVNEDIAR